MKLLLRYAHWVAGGHPDWPDVIVAFVLFPLVAFLVLFMAGFLLWLSFYYTYGITLIPVAIVIWLIVAVKRAADRERG